MSMSEAMQGAVPVDGFELPYRIEGQGRDVLVIGDTVYYPRTFSAGLREHLRLIFVSHRGFGRPTAPVATPDFGLDTLLDDIETVRQHLNLGQVVILGHSGHAYLALEYAKRYPAHVSHVVLLAISPDSTDASFRAADQYLEESVCPERKAALAAQMSHLEADMNADPDRAFIARMLCSGPRIWFDYSYDASGLWAGVEPVPALVNHMWGHLFRVLDITQGLNALDKPVFLALGRYDYWNPPHLWERIRHQFRELRIRVFERSGHTPQLEEPTAFDRELLSWLDTTA